MNDEQTSDVIEAVLNLAVTVRDEVGPGVAEAARAVLDAAGDPLAALTVAAALVRVDEPIDAWWQHYTAAPVVLSQRPLSPCGTHSAFNRHRANSEPIDAACRLAERAYQRDRKRISRSVVRRRTATGTERVA